MHRHPLGHGQLDTHALVKANGENNTSPRAGTPYDTITWPEFIERAARPSKVPKDNADWTMASTYNGFDARNGEPQREHGVFALLPGDIDKGNSSFEEVSNALETVLGDCEFLIYSSSSATQNEKKWRFWIPLSAPIKHAGFTATQEALFDLLEDKGLILDRNLSQPARIVILPNRGDWYQHKHHKGPRLELHPQHPIVLRRAERAAEAAAEAQMRANRPKIQLETDAEEIASALNAISPDMDYYDWLSVGMALKTEFGESGFRLWDDWSAGGAKYDSRIMQGKWKSFREGKGYTAGTIYYLAKQAGWERPTEKYFEKIQLPPQWADWSKAPKPGLPSATEARQRLSEAVEAFHKVNAATMSLTEFVAPLHILEASLGLGKTTTALKATVERIRQLRKQGDEQGAAVVLVPMHRLSEQVKADLKRMAPELSVEILRGVEAQDPDNPGETVCKQLDEYRKRQRLMDEAPCEKCPHAESCMFLKGREAKADIYVQAHGAIATQAAPAKEKRNQYLDHVVIDESPLSAMLFGTNGTSNISLAAWEVARLPAHPDGAADLAAWRAKAAQAAQANGEGPMLAAALDAAGLTPDICREASGLEWARKVELSKDADKETRKRERAQLEHNATIIVTAGIWKDMAELLASSEGIGGRLYVRADADKGLVIERQGVREPHKTYNSAPILALDATADAAVAEAVLRRQAARVDVIRAAEPMLHVTQDMQFSGSKSMLLDSPTESGKKACRNNRRRLESFIARKARKLAPKRLLFVGNKDLVEQLELPDNVLKAHFNALRGLNDFQDVAAAVIVGRPQPNERAVNRIASAIFNRHIEGRIDWRGQGERNTNHGPVMCKASIHPDDDAQRILKLTRDAEVEQAIGRLRGVNRSEPVEVFLLSDAIVRQTVELSPVWAEQVRSSDPLEQMLLENGIAFTSPAHAAKAYPDKWKSLNSAKYALNGATSEKTSLGSLYEEFSPVVVKYRLPRAKEQSVAVLDVRRHPVPQASLERILGPLAHFEVLETCPTDTDSAASETHNRLEYISKSLGYTPPITVREVESPVFIAGQVPAAVMAESLRRRGWQVRLE